MLDKIDSIKIDSIKSALSQPICCSYRESPQHFDQVKDLPVLRAELLRRGYSSVDIAKILGGNWRRVSAKPGIPEVNGVTGGRGQPAGRAA
jgi:microsomal dipeptidase-like Zn-dependent dipeptidase